MNPAEAQDVIRLDIWEVILICVVVAFVVYGLTKLIISYKFKAESAKRKAYYQAKQQEEEKQQEVLKDRALQRLECLDKGKILGKRLLNSEEETIYYALVKVFKEHFNISPQVSFKAFLYGEKETEAWKSFSDFYCDFLITYKKGERRGKPAAVIEYHGGGHFGSDSQTQEKVRKNDYLKNQILDKAEIAYIVIRENDIKGDSASIDDRVLNEYIIRLYDSLSKQERI